MRRWWWIALACLFAAPVSAQEAPTQTVLEIAAEQDGYTRFGELLETFVPDLYQTLTGDDVQFTLLLPSDSALENADRRFETNTDDFFENPVYMEALLRYHIIPTDVSELSGFVQLYGTMLAEQSVMSGEANDLNGVPVVETIPAVNGTVHLIDSVLIPPVFRLEGMMPPFDPDQVLRLPDVDLNSRRRPSVRQALERAGDYTYLVRYFEQYPDVYAIVESGGLYTLFAATDQAWERELGGADAVEALLFSEVPPGDFDVARRMVLYGVGLGYLSPETLLNYLISGPYALMATYPNGYFATLTLDMMTMEDVLINGYPLRTNKAIPARNVLIYPFDGVLYIG